MSERIRGSYDDALYKSTYTLLYFTWSGTMADAVTGDRHGRCKGAAWPFLNLAIVSSNNRPKYLRYLSSACMTHTEHRGRC